MRKNKSVISVEIINEDGSVVKRPNVMALNFLGDPLPERTFNSLNAGQTTFRLFYTPQKRGYVGKVLMGTGSSDFRLPFRLFARTAVDYLSAEIMQVLNSGIFEGEIVSQRVELHPDRNTFIKNDAFLDLCIAIDDWYEKFGKEYAERVKERRQDTRLQTLAIKSLRVIDELLKEEVHAPLRDVINTFKFGTVGNGHAPIPKKHLKGLQELTSLSATNGGACIPREEGDDKPAERPPGSPEKEKDEHHPGTATGPRGIRRKIVKYGSLGLQFSREMLEGDPDLWKLDVEYGILTFNMRHPLWIKCVDNDSALMKLQECVALQALTIHMLPEHNRAVQRKAFDEYNHALISWILMSGK
jgi:hypothetical protein